MEVEIELPNHGKVKGMGIASGVTLIVGGGFHGERNTRTQTPPSLPSLPSGYSFALFLLFGPDPK